MKNRIQKLLNEQGYARKELHNFLEARGFKISRQRMYGYCANHFQPQGALRRAIAEFFKLQITDIFYEKSKGRVEK